VELTATSKRIAKAQGLLTEAFKDAKARGSHLATKDDWGEAIKTFNREITVRMHQVPTVPVTAENFNDVRIVLAPKSEGDQMTFYFDIVPPHFFSTSV
jgi:hypothetical protein